MIEGFKHGAAIGQLAQTIEAHGIQPLEDVAVFAMLRRAAVLLDETLNFLEAGDDPLLARRPARFLLRLDLDAKLVEKRVVLVGEPLATRSLRLHAGQEGHPLGHALLPGVGRGDRGQAARAPA